MECKPRLRPVLDQRMPTLITKATGPTVPETSFPTDFNGMMEMMNSPPRHMRDVRATMNKELKSLTKLLHRVEREYYSDKGNVNNEVEHYVHSIKVLMKSLMMFDLNNATAVDDLIKLASNPARYTGERKYVADLKEVYAKVQTFLPDKLSGIVDRCRSLLDKVCRFCVSFYDPENDPYLETSDHYTEQIQSWRERGYESLQSVRSLYQRFRTSGITLKMLSAPVATFSSRNSLQRVLFVVMLADAMTHLKNVIEILKAWLKADENYSGFVKNDLAELERLKDDKVRDLRECRQKNHSLTYKLSQYEIEYAKLAADANALKEKEGFLRIEEVHLVNQSTDMEREIEIKERRREQLRRQSPILGPAPSPEPTAETVEDLSFEIKGVKERLPFVHRQIASVKLKLTFIDEKISSLDRLSNDIQATKRELKQVEQDRGRKEKEYSEVERAVDVAKRVLMCKTANDSVEKLYYSVPVAPKAAKVARSRDDVIVSDPIEKACSMIAKRIDRDWVSLYRSLPFHPLRGSETIGQDIVELAESGARGSCHLVARKSLDRWRRHHTRTSVNDLRKALKKIKRFDILKTLDVVLNPPAKVIQAPFEVQEEIPPPVATHLIPYYKQIERYDQIRASRIAAEAEAAKKRAIKQAHIQQQEEQRQQYLQQRKIRV